MNTFKYLFIISHIKSVNSLYGLYQQIDEEERMTDFDKAYLVALIDYKITNFTP